MTVHLHVGDLPEGLDFGASVAIDTETMGLNPHRDRLCVAQFSAGDGVAHLVRFEKGQYAAPRIKEVLINPNIEKIFHFARFDVAVFQQYLGVTTAPIYCTKIASKLARTYTDRHGLKEVVRELTANEISKHQQSSDWGRADLSDAQLEYAASDVLYLHDAKKRLDEMLAREGRTEIARACFDFLPHRAALDLMGWEETDIFAHS
ncbi:MAG: ribonuclease D [Neomegalonema sp.]|nr:ribonuclease D [Neomegalonema sp.]